MLPDLYASFILNYLQNPDDGVQVALDLLLHDDDTLLLIIYPEHTLDPTPNDPLASIVPSVKNSQSFSSKYSGTLFDPKQNEFVCIVGAWNYVLCRVLKWSDITTKKQRGSYHCSCYIKVTLSCDLCRGDCCSENCYVVFCCTITLSLHLRTRQRTHFHAPTIQTNSFCFGSNITVFPCPMSIYKFIFILSRNPFYQQHLKNAKFRL